jgi:DNA invertase Pin-like site-specific DNA recombinase
MEYTGNKITHEHLKRPAILYIRQSTLRQVYENTESTLRQYALKERLVSLGWDSGSIVIIDKDLGQSGSETGNREGFKELVSEVSNGAAGAVACIEASRLSRSSGDWGRLIEYCALTNTLLIDADGVYNPNDFNDRLLLGLKGTMSEAELHFLMARMRGGLLNKAKRGELKKPLPIGYLYDDCGKIIKDTNIEVRQAVELLFESFRTVGSACGIVKYYKEKGYKFPYRVYKGFKKGEVHWTDITHSRILNILHNPAYAGAYHYGGHQIRHTPQGKKLRLVPKEEWHVLLKDNHEPYILYEEYEMNEKILTENAHPRSEDGRKSPPREGPALLQGIVICGKCGVRMTVRYTHNRKNCLTPHYVCQRNSIEHGAPICQYINGLLIDSRISEIMLERLTPLAVQTSIAVQEELNKRKSDQDNYFKVKAEKVRYEAELARRRYMNVDPNNRLVALELESAWNRKLAELEETEKEYNGMVMKNNADTYTSDAIRLKTLSEDFRQIWEDENVGEKDRKRIVRYLIEDATLLKDETGITAHVRFKGGTTETLKFPKPLKSYETWTTAKHIIDFIDEQAEHFTEMEIAESLNAKGYKSGKDQAFTTRIIQRIMTDYDIKSKRQRYLIKGYISSSEKAGQLGVNVPYLNRLIRDGRFQGEAVRISGKNEYLFKP